MIFSETAKAHIALVFFSKFVAGSYSLGSLAAPYIDATLITFVLLQYGNQRLPGAKVMAYTYLVPGWVIVWEVLPGRGLVELNVLFGIGLTVFAMLMLLR